MNTNTPEAKNGGSPFTLFNIIAAIILIVGLVIVVIRFAKGLGAVTNLSDEYPWGLWIGFDVLCGVALAAGGYVIATSVHLFGMKDYRIILRPAILTGFLGYLFVVIALLFDLGRPWRLPYPVFYSLGPQSVMFLVAWHVLLYLTVQFMEFSPAIFEWLDMKAARRWIHKIMVGTCIVGVILSTLHQSALGALFLLAPTKLHPLWYSPLLPIYFFITSIVAGLSMVIFEGMLSHRFLKKQIDPAHIKKLDRITLALGKAASVTLLCYFFLKLIGITHDGHWALLGTPMGSWFLFEMLVFVLLPCILFGWGSKMKNVGMVRAMAFLAVVGIILNRLNVSIIAFKWNEAVRYIPSWMEIWVTIAIITLAVVMYRWIVIRMPVLREHPAYKETA